MSLDDYRDQLVERLTGCADTAAARALLAEADLRLMNAKLTALTQSKFWESLQEELTAIADAAAADAAAGSAGREDLMKLAAVVAAAQARIARYRERLSEAPERPNT